MARGNGIGFLGSAGLGAALMYLLDPDRGRRRRAIARDKLAGGRRFILLRKTIVIHAPIGEVFRFWTHVENFPRFMEHVLEVRAGGQDGRSHWTVRGPGGLPMSWDAEVTQSIPDQLFAWKTLPGGAIEHTGTVHFEQDHPDATRVHVQMSYHPPAGALGHTLASLFGSDPSSRMDDDLVTLKSLLEKDRTRAHGRRVVRDETERTQEPRTGQTF